MKRNMGASIDNKTRRAVYERDGFRCALCDSTDGLQIHHVKPRGEGGADHPMNLITLCWRCHAAAHGDFFYSSPDMFDRSLLGNASVEKWNVRRWLIESMELECVRYVSDYYAERGEGGGGASSCRWESLLLFGGAPVSAAPVVAVSRRSWPTADGRCRVRRPTSPPGVPRPRPALGVRGVPPAAAGGKRREG